MAPPGSARRRYDVVIPAPSTPPSRPLRRLGIEVAGACVGCGVPPPAPALGPPGAAGGAGAPAAGGLAVPSPGTVVAGPGAVVVVVVSAVVLVELDVVVVVDVSSSSPHPTARVRASMATVAVLLGRLMSGPTVVVRRARSIPALEPGVPTAQVTTPMKPALAWSGDSQVRHGDE
ncbi:MAG TPA: hypothetical protein VHG90_05360 [Acidimicrobiales bacterium]|nr:hypothetical protein [Acidimicrobiales bacterium]